MNGASGAHVRTPEYSRTYPGKEALPGWTTLSYHTRGNKMENFNKQPNKSMVEEDDNMGEATGGEGNLSPLARLPVITLERVDLTPARSTTSGQDNQSIASTVSLDSEGSSTMLYEEDELGREIRKARKRGRPVTTGDYERKKRRDALRQEERRREKEELEERRILDDSYVPPETKASLNIPTVEDIMEELRDAPTPDVSARAFEHLQRVHRVAAVSKNLKGTFVNQLKTAVNVGKACATTLALRAQSISAPETEKSEAEELRKQLRAIRMENTRLQKEADQARENLRMALECQDASRTGKTVITKTVQEEKEMDFPMDHSECEDTRTSPTLPPREEWPQAVRPPIMGISKVLEDREDAPIGLPVIDRIISRRLDSLFSKWCDKMDQALGKFTGRVPQPKGQGANPPVTKSKASEKGNGSGSGTTAPHVPTLAATKRRQQGGTEESGTGRISAHPVPTSKPAKKQAQKGTRDRTDTTRAPNVVPEGKGGTSSVPLTNHRDAPQETWATVVKKGGKKVGSQHTATPNKPGLVKLTAGKKATGETKSDKRGKEAVTRVRKLPKTAAVTVTCPQGQYEKTILEARSKIKLSDLKINGFRTRRAVTGALIFEIAGEDGREKADAFASKLREVLAHREGVKVARPAKMGDIRLRDLDDSVGAEDVLQAIMGLGKFQRTDISVGPVRKTGNGLGTAWARCPLEAANIAIEMGTIRVGWALAKVESLETRPLQCFRCLEGGHVRATCTSKVDRSGRCYRCGEVGHEAKYCGAKPKCSVCSDHGRPDGHRTGSKSCLPARRRKGGAEKAPANAPKTKISPDVLATPGPSGVRVVSNVKVTDDQLPLTLRRNRSADTQVSQDAAKGESQPMEVAE